LPQRGGWCFVLGLKRGKVPLPINEAPREPLFTDWIVSARLLGEPLRLIDVGAQGGLHPRWKWLGNYLEAWAFDPLPDVVAQLEANNTAPDRIRFHCMGLGNEDGDRLFTREANGYCSAFLPAAMTESELGGRDAAGNLPPNWCRAPIRKLDTLSAAGLFGAVDHIKLDCEGFEIEALRGAQRVLQASGVFAVESETSLKLHPWFPPCHFAVLYQLLGPFGFDVYDMEFYRYARPPLAGKFEHRGRPDTFDFLFLRGFGEHDELAAHSIDRLIKMAIVAELHALQDVASGIVARAADRLSLRFDPAKAQTLLRRSAEAMAPA
jgi:FkbM family methyltransferase